MVFEGLRLGAMILQRLCVDLNLKEPNRDSPNRYSRGGLVMSDPPVHRLGRPIAGHKNSCSQDLELK